MRPLKPRHSDNDAASQPLAGVRLVGMPVEKARLALEYASELLKEVTLLEADQRLSHNLSAVTRFCEDLRVLLPAFEGAITEAASKGQDRVTFDSSLAETVLPQMNLAVLRKMQEGLHQAAAATEDGRLLLLPPAEEVAQLRDWVLEEIERQLAGGDPRSCPW